MKLSKLRLRGTNKARRWRGSLHSLASLSLNRRWLMDAFMQHHWPLAKNKVTESLGLSVCFFSVAGPGPVPDPGSVWDPGASVCQCETDRRTGRRGRTGRTHCWETGLMRKDEDFFFPPLSSDSFYVCLQIRILKLSESVCVLVFFLSCFNLLKKCHTSQRRHLVLLLWWFTVGVSGALLGGTPAADLRFSHLQTDVC